MKAEFTDVVALAAFTAELVRQGVTFHVRQESASLFTVSFTGGF